MYVNYLSLSLIILLEQFPDLYNAWLLRYDKLSEIAYADRPMFVCARVAVGTI